MSELIEPKTTAEQAHDAMRELAALEWSQDAVIGPGSLTFRGVLGGMPRRIIAGASTEEAARRLMNLAVDMAFGRA